MLNVLEYACIYQNKWSSEYAAILNVSNAAHSKRSLYKLLRAGEVLWYSETIQQTFCQKHKKKCSGIYFEIVFLHTLKATFWMENLTQRWTQSGTFFPKSGHFI